MVLPRVASHNYLLTAHVEGSEGDLRALYVPDLKKNALFLIFLLQDVATFRKKPYLCTIKITNNRAAQLDKLCTRL